MFNVIHKNKEDLFEIGFENNHLLPTEKNSDKKRGISLTNKGLFIDGININENCGSTHLEAISNFVKENKLDLGIAYDGDADRCLLVDSDGEIVDGDYILAIMSNYLHEDIVTIRNLSNIKLSYNTVKEEKPEVRFTGIRDVDLVNAFNSIGYDADGKKGVTKKTAILIIPHEGFSSNKMKQVDPNKCMILTPEGAWRMLRSYGVIKK